MALKGNVNEFLRATFRSIWALELLLLMAEDGTRQWSKSDLVSALRASDLIVDRSTDELTTAGLIVPEGKDRFRYSPSSIDLIPMVDGVRELYKRSPDAIRRMIINTQQSGISAFAEAFRLRKD